MKTVPELPDTYTNTKPPQVTNMTLPDMEKLNPQLALEYQWLQKVSITEVPDNENITWSFHHADKKRGPAFKACISSLLPLLKDKAI